MAKKRNSSIELLRLIAMLMVLLYHWAYHGGIRTFAEYDFGVNIVFMQFLLTLGRTGCSIFALITGYFMINSKQENYYPKIVSLAGTTHLYYFVILVIMFATNAVPVTPTLAVKSLLPMLFGTWYIIAYILLLFLVPFINTWLRGLDKKVYLRLVITLLMIWSVIPTASADAWSFSDIDFFIVMYVLGGYLKLHPIEKKLPWGVMTLSAWALMLLSVISIDVLALVTDHRGLLDKAYYFGKINSLLGVFLVVSMFMWFSHREFYSTIINSLGGTTLGIYLLHNNFLFRKWAYRTFMPNIDYIENPYLNVLLKTAVIFLAGAAIELLRAVAIGKWFDGVIVKIFNKRKAAKGN